jgi:hypothetical protein
MPRLIYISLGIFYRVEKKMSMLKNRLFCYEDESVEGYLYRVSQANYVSLNILNEYFNPYFRNGVGDLKEIMLYLNEENVHFFHRNSIFFINNSGLQKDNFRRNNYTKFCPLCLSEKPYHRIHWQIAPIVVCKKHKIVLLHKCDECHQQVSYKDVIENRCPRLYKGRR